MEKHGYPPCPEATAQGIRLWTIGFVQPNKEHGKDVLFGELYSVSYLFSSYWPQKLSKLTESSFKFCFWEESDHRTKKNPKFGYETICQENASECHHALHHRAKFRGKLK